jgi:hypothetical protein
MANFPAKFSFSSSTANCGGAAQPDFVVYNTGGRGGSSDQATIVAYDNLYSGCGGTVPLTYWAYDTGTNASVTTSPVFSLDGTQVAFVQTAAAGEAQFVVLRWAASDSSTVSSPTVLTRTRRSAYPTCSAPCLTTGYLYAGGQNDADTNSSLFYDYATDTAFVGDDDGWLHQISPVFNGEPGEVRNSTWPVQLNPTSPAPALLSPVYSSGTVFVEDVGGFLYRVDVASGSVVTSGQLDFSYDELGSGFADSPMVDATAGLVYVFASSDGSTNCSVSAMPAACSAVYVLSSSFASRDQGMEVRVGSSSSSGSTPVPMLDGDFDSTYKNSDNATGNLYVCGNTGGFPTLYQVSISGGTPAAAVAGPVLSPINSACSPLTDAANPNVSGITTEWIFVGVPAGSLPSACAPEGCIFNFEDAPWQPLTAYSVGQEILDTNFNVQVVESAGISSASAPAWQTGVGATTADGGVQWLDQGTASAVALFSWTANTTYGLESEILDANGNIEVVTTAGTSGSSLPVFGTVPGATTDDGSNLVWTNLGAIATATLPSFGGTSGIIIDNTVSSGTLLGASEVYFATLADQYCGTSGSTGECAVQASQPALQ